MDQSKLSNFKAKAEEWISEVGSPYGEYGEAVPGEKYQRRYRAALPEDPEFYKEWMNLSEKERLDYQAWMSEEQIPTDFCPICNFSTLSDDDLSRYILKESGKTMAEWAKGVKERFGSYNEFAKYLL